MEIAHIHKIRNGIREITLLQRKSKEYIWELDEMDNSQRKYNLEKHT